MLECVTQKFQFSFIIEKFDSSLLRHVVKFSSAWSFESAKRLHFVLGHPQAVKLGEMSWPVRQDPRLDDHNAFMSFCCVPNDSLEATEDCRSWL